MKKPWICAMVFVMGLFVAVPGAAAQAKPAEILYTYVSNWTVPRAQWGDMDKFSQSMKPILDKLIDDGTLTGYGFAETVVHTENGPTHVDWMQATTVGGILRALDAVREAANTSSILGNARHWDTFLRSTVPGYKAGTYEHAYLRGATFAIKPGHVDDWSQDFKTYMAPELAKMVDDGTLAGYQLDTLLVHEGDINTLDYAFVTTQPDGIDKVQAMIRRVEAKNPAIGAAFDSWERDKGHADSIALVKMMRTK